MVEIPLRLLDLQGDGFHLLMEVVAFNKPYNAVLDTGASKTVFDKSIVEKILEEKNHLSKETVNLMDSDKLSTGLGTNTMRSFTVEIPELKLGELSLKNIEIAVLDLSTINFAYKELEIEPVIGVIGGDILRSHSALINYKTLILRLNKTKKKIKI